MSVFDAIDFYPTTKETARKMFTPFVSKLMKGGLSILDPSCGEGFLIKEAIRYKSSIYSEVKHQYYAFELNPELSLIASEIEGLKILGSDFLKYSGGVFFNLIVMNPPFSEGDKHLLHAWKILHEGDIVCLLNEETIKNPYTTNRRILAEIIEKNGSVEYLGACFSDASRKTNVRVAMVRLHKKAEANPFDFEKLGLDGEGNVFSFDFEAQKNNAIATNDVIGNMVLCFEQLQSAMATIIQGINKAQFYGNSIGFDIFKNIGEFCKYGSYSYRDAKKIFNPYELFNNMLSDANNSAWNIIFNDTNFADKLTSDFKKNFEKFRKTQGGAIFTKDNVLELLSFIYENQGNIIHQCIVSIFDRLTQYSEKNKEINLRWKTNSHYKLNRKFIMPDCGRWCNIFNHLDVGWGTFKDWADDLDVACSHLSGEKIDKNGKESLFKTAYDFGRTAGFWNARSESRFFNIRVFKKGTIHVEFKDVDLWERFNITAAEGKNWLSDDLDKKGSKKK